MSLFTGLLDSTQTTVLLSAARAGDARAADLLFPRIYDELRRLSQVHVSKEPGVITISATGLVHEAYLKLVEGADWNDRAHFMAIASRAMRQILTDRARARQAIKRGGKDRPLTLAADLNGARETPSDVVLAIDVALDRLADRNAELAQIVELRFFGGLDVPETAEILGVSERTAARMWSRAKAHLRAELA